MTDRPILLVVDDESSVCRAIVRLLGGRDAVLLTACTAAEAEAILESQPVTHLLCDLRLGPGEPSGFDLAASWRARYVSLQSVVILTGIDVKGIEIPPGIDDILPKVTDADEIARVLGLAG